MKKISVEQAINSGAWFQYQEGEIVFRIRFINFRQVQLSEIDNIDKVNSETPIKEGKIFLLTTELINLSKQENSRIYIKIMDNERFKFDTINDHHITIYSDFAKRLKGHGTTFIPKFKYFNDYIYLVPNEETKYFLVAYDDATLTEI